MSGLKSYIIGNVVLKEIDQWYPKLFYGETFNNRQRKMN